MAGTVWDAGGGANTNITTATNWDGDQAPAFDGTASVTFQSVNGSVTFNQDVAFRGIDHSYNGSNTWSGAGRTITLGSGGFTVSTPNFARTITVNPTVALAASQTFSVTQQSPILDLVGPVSDGNAGYTLTIGTPGALGTVRLKNDANQFGAVTLTAGTLRLDYSTSTGGKLPDTAAVNFNGGILDLANGSGSIVEQMGTVTLTSGYSQVTRSAGTAATAQLGAITRSVGGGAVNFAAASIATTSTTNTNGILGGWASLASNDWAVNSTDGANGPITAYTGYTDVASGGAIVDGSTTNVRLLGESSLGSATTVTVNSVRLSNAGGSYQIQPMTGKTLATNAIYSQRSLNVSNTAGVGTLRSATAGGELTLGVASGQTLIVNANIVDNSSASPLTALGPGTVALAGTSNTFSGTTTVAGGTLRIDRQAALQNSPLDTSGRGVVTLNNGAGTYTFGGLRGGTNLASVITGSPTNLTTLALNPQASTSHTYSGVIGNLAASTAVTKSGAGTQTLSGANTYSGGTTINAGTLIAGHASAVGSGGVTINSGGVLQIAQSILLGNAVTINGGTLRFAGGGLTRTSTAGLASVGILQAGSDGIFADLAPSIGWASRVAGVTYSDILQLSNTSGTPQMLSLTYEAGLGESIISGLVLGWNDAGTWKNAIDGNTGNNADPAQMGYTGSFSQFQAANGTYLANYIGAYGRDNATRTVWAVVNHNSDFAAVLIVPEPALAAPGLVACGLAARILARRRRGRA